MSLCKIIHPLTGTGNTNKSLSKFFLLLPAWLFVCMRVSVFICNNTILLPFFHVFGKKYSFSFQTNNLWEKINTRTSVIPETCPINLQTVNLGILEDTKSAANNKHSQKKILTSVWHFRRKVLGLFLDWTRLSSETWIEQIYQRQFMASIWRLRP